MPYIPQEQREDVMRRLAAGHGLQEPGELSYAVAEAIEAFMGTGDFRFERMAAALGAVDAAVDQFNEQVVRPYEQRKRMEQGNVFNGSRRRLTASEPTSGPGCPD